MSSTEEHPQNGTDTSKSAPWLSLAHSICSDAGVPPGEITARLQRLREILATHGIPPQVSGKVHHGTPESPGF